MATVDIIQEMKIPYSEKQGWLLVAARYDEGAPDTYYLNPFQLNRGLAKTKADLDNPLIFQGYKEIIPSVWERFLDLPDIDSYRRARIEKLKQYDADRALKRLSDTGDPQAMKVIARLTEPKRVNNTKQVIIQYVPLLDDDSKEGD